MHFIWNQGRSLLLSGTKARYVDVLNPGRRNSNPTSAVAPPADLFAPLAPMTMPANLFVPTAGMVCVRGVSVSFDFKPKFDAASTRGFFLLFKKKKKHKIFK